jgi:hypothetical protein
MATVERPPSGLAASSGAAGTHSYPRPLHHYNAGGTIVLAAGIISGIVFTSWGLLPAWAAFLAGATPTFVIAALVYTFRGE